MQEQSGKGTLKALSSPIGKRWISQMYSCRLNFETKLDGIKTAKKDSEETGTAPGAEPERNLILFFLLKIF